MRWALPASWHSKPYLIPFPLSSLLRAFARAAPVTWKVSLSFCLNSFSILSEWGNYLLGETPPCLPLPRSGACLLSAP